MCGCVYVASKIYSYIILMYNFSYLQNNIRGCGPALLRNNINGRAFLNLDKQAMADWGISMVTQTKILVLLKGLDGRCPKNEILLLQSAKNKLLPSKNSKLTAPLPQTVLSTTPTTPSINHVSPSIWPLNILFAYYCYLHLVFSKFAIIIIIFQVFYMAGIQSHPNVIWNQPYLSQQCRLLCRQNQTICDRRQPTYQVLKVKLHSF